MSRLLGTRSACQPAVALSLPTRLNLSSLQVRHYAQLAHNDPRVAPDYEQPPRPIQAWLRDPLKTGTKASRALRKQPGAASRIPGVLMRKEGPLLITMAPGSIQSWLDKEHFLGRRYLLTIGDSTEPLEVYPTTLGLDPMTLRPTSVAFAPWTGKTRLRLTPEMRLKTRKWEADVIKEEKLKTRLIQLSRDLKAHAQSGPRFIFEADEKLLAIHARTDRSVISLEEELETILKASRESNAEVLHLEPEEQDRDEVMKFEDDEDDN